MLRIFDNYGILAVLVALQLSCSESEHKDIVDKWQDNYGNIITVNKDVAGDYEIDVELNFYESNIVKLSDSCSGQVILRQNSLICDSGESSNKVILDYSPEQEVLQVQIGNESSFESFHRVVKSFS